MAFTSRTVTATYLKPDSSAEVGTVSLELNESITDGTSAIPCIPATETLDANGTATWTVVANDDSTTVPAGSYYLVVERLEGATVHTWTAVIPHVGAPATFDLLTLRT